MRFRSYERKSALEVVEDIEILRFLELGVSVKMIEAGTATLAVDVPGDVAAVESVLRAKLTHES
ncbi:3-deoxy-manno-octulosonate cytidylyltransferase [compost metagenome]